ncbi:MAG: hypothetical protein WAS72_07220 [Saprospiraceae bacterium]
MLNKLTKKKTIIILTLIGIIIYFNEDIRAYIYLRGNNLPTDTWTMLKNEGDKMVELKNLFENQNDSIVFPDNQNLIEIFKTFYNNKEFENTYSLYSEEYQQNHNILNYSKFLEIIFKEFGTIDSFKKEEINFSFSENNKYFKSKESYVTNFKNGIGLISVVVDMFDSIHTKINEIGFQLDSSNKKINIFNKQKENLFQLLENKDYKKLNELTTIEYNLSLTENNFKIINENFFKNRNINLIYTFVKLKKENDNFEFSQVYEEGNKMLEITLEVDTIGSYKINNFKLTE